MPRHPVPPPILGYLRYMLIIYYAYGITSQSLQSNGKGGGERERERERERDRENENRSTVVLPAPLLDECNPTLPIKVILIQVQRLLFCTSRDCIPHHPQGPEVLTNRTLAPCPLFFLILGFLFSLSLSFFIVVHLAHFKAHSHSGVRACTDKVCGLLPKVLLNCFAWKTLSTLTDDDSFQKPFISIFWGRPASATRALLCSSSASCFKMLPCGLHFLAYNIVSPLFRLVIHQAKNQISAEKHTEWRDKKGISEMLSRMCFVQHSTFQRCSGPPRWLASSSSLLESFCLLHCPSLNWHPRVYFQHFFISSLRHLMLRIMCVLGKQMKRRVRITPKRSCRTPVIAWSSSYE